MNLRIGNIVYKPYDYGHEEVIITSEENTEGLTGIPITVQNLVNILGFVITSFSDHEEIMYEAKEHIIRYLPDSEYKFEISGVAKFNISYISLIF